ncbi:MAG: DUF4064 domain-containing protein [Sarcina sp.]
MKRRAEFVLGIIAGVLGILGGLFEGVIGEVMNLTTTVLPIMGLENYILEKSGTVLVILSILGIVGAILANSSNILAGIFMLIAAGIGFLISMFIYMIPAIIFAVAGLMCLLRTPKYTNE